jgi:hypothetical protein
MAKESSGLVNLNLGKAIFSCDICGLLTGRDINLKIAK